MATKVMTLVVASLLLSAASDSLNDSKKKLKIAPDDSLELMKEFSQAMRDEAPLLRAEEAKAATFHKKALTQHKLGVETAEDPFLSGEWANDFERDVSALIMGLSNGGFGATPFGDSVQKIANLITTDMMPKVLNAHESDQKELYRLAGLIQDCHTAKATEIATADLKKAEYEGKSIEHKECRSQEASLYTTNVDCHEAWITAKEDMKLKCAAHEAKEEEYGETTNNKAIMEKATGETVQVYIERISATICGTPLDCSDCGDTTGTASGTAASGTAASGTAASGTAASGTASGSTGGCIGGKGMLEDLNCHKDECDDATKVYNDLTIQCAADDSAWITKRGECDSIQDEMDGFSCNWAIQTKDLCEKYETCHHNTKQAYIDFKIQVKDGYPELTPPIRSLEEDRKAEWRGLKRMLCLITAFGDGEVTHEEIDDCKTQDHNPDADAKLTIDVLDITTINAEVCIVTDLYPNTAPYKEQEFVPLPNFAKGRMDANECVGLAAVNTTPFTGSPDTCQCTRVPMDGPYAPGPVVRCNNCIDVSRTKDINSCPVGTKLFSPQSRADWASFLTSAAPWDETTGVADPSFIIDVSCPEDRCGESQSYNYQQTKAYRKRWTTSDGSMWWLRADADPSEKKWSKRSGTCTHADQGGWNQENKIPIGNPASCMASCQADAECKGLSYRRADQACFYFKHTCGAGDPSVPTADTCTVTPENPDPVQDCSAGDVCEEDWCNYDWTNQGDYSPDCYIGLTMGATATEDEVTYHEDRCNYHSKSYYCQNTAVSLIPGNASPEACVCKKVELVGSYSAGVLIKCDKCLDVYKSTELNSCPSGTKMFSPRTRDDWVTFLASAQPLKNPFWIIDITRPQDGCSDGCTSTPMHSLEASQATWTTSDDSPWWLRGTAYSQPSGDYTANCYMSIDNAPANADDIQFDDHGCYAHARSYYCQSLKTTTTTTTRLTCANYACSVAGYVKKAEIEDASDPDESTCCEATCASFACPTHYAKKAGIDAELNPTSTLCCEATCAAHTCSTDWIKKTGIDSTVGSTDSVCCDEIPQIVTVSSSSTEVITRDGFKFECKQWDGDWCTQTYWAPASNAVSDCNNNNCIPDDTSTLRPVWHGDTSAQCRQLCWIATGDATCVDHASMAGSGTDYGWTYTSSSCACDPSQRQYVNIAAGGYTENWSLDGMSWQRSGSFSKYKCNWR